jgi:hypothetical protein
MVVDSYHFGSIRIDGKEYSHDVIISGPVVYPWRRATSHEVTINDLEHILELKPKSIIFGTGEAGVMRVMLEAEEYLQKEGISFKKLRTPEAVEELNRSTAPGVVGAFHLTC